MSIIVENIEFLIRPTLLLILSLLLFNLPVTILKIKLFLQGIVYFLFCNDKSYKTTDPLSFFSPILSKSKEEKQKNISEKNIVFIRHGESTWNETFNKGSHRSRLNFVLFFLPNLIKAILYELYFVLSGQKDSWFYDSPLSPLGIDQAEELHTFLYTEEESSTNNKELLGILRGDKGSHSSTLLCSSLRRALSTMAVTFQRRLKNCKIEVLPCLQEISRNPDTLTLTPPKEQVQASWVDSNYSKCNFQDIFTNKTNMSNHTGNKPVSSNGLIRMNKFCDDAFSYKTNTLIVGGHSIWFRSFFRSFLPSAVDHVSKKKKIVNAGCVAFTLMKASTESGDKYMIDPKTITVVYGGFK